MYLLVLLKELSAAMKEQKSVVFLALFLAAGEYLIHYVDDKHEKGIKKIDEVKIELKADAERDRAEMKETLVDIKRSVQVTENRVWEIYKESAKRGFRARTASYNSLADHD
jgi:hypothetical protein